MGFTEDEMVGESIAKIIPEQLLNEEREIIDNLKRGLKTEYQSSFRLTKEGNLIPVSIIVSPIYDQLGNVTAASTIIRDVRKRVEMEDALALKVKELERSNEDLKQFAHAISHDLKEPLRAVSGFVELLRDSLGNDIDSDRKEYIDYTIDGVKRMNILIDDLLDYSKAGSPELSLVDTQALVMDVESLLFHAIKERRARVVYSNLPSVVADKRQLRQVFQNLISNGIKYNTAEVPMIEIAAEEDSEKTTFTVKDNGIGIKQDDFEKIFKIFQRLHTKDKYPGTGIGLALCQRVIERLGGKIWLESKPQEGTSFRFTVPKRKID